MAKPQSDELQAVKDWYVEWIKFPTYLATASLGFLAFSFTELLPQAGGGSEYIYIAWILLGGSAILSFIGMLGAYASYDIWNRRFLEMAIEPLGMKYPKERTKWVSRWGKLSYGSTMSAMVLLLLATGLIGIHVRDSVKAGKPNQAMHTDGPATHR